MTDFHRPLRVPANREALIERAVSEPDGLTSVGGLAPHLRPARPARASPPSDPKTCSGVVTIARLVQFARRESRKTPEQYAKVIGIELSELEHAEAGVGTPEPRVLFSLSEALDISYHKLMTLAGHWQQRDTTLEREALRFAAFSAPMDKLSKDEAQALHDLLRLLHD